ncbi:MAG TPA: lysine--tRNA ligase [Nitriliruptorales bacterium]|nr:lysine--tRNA ligase [Nitriliruptorales bacterium]
MTSDGREPPAEDASRLAELIAARRARAEALRERGVDPHPVRFTPTRSLAEVRERWGGLAPGEQTGEQVTVAGRLVAKRELGGVAFGVLREDGVDLQLFCQAQTLGEHGMALFGELDVGDWVGAEGEVLATRKGELSVRPVRLRLLGKSLRPLPEKWHGLRDVEQRYRQRELDLIVNADTRGVFVLRSRAVGALRRELEARGFLEVETPMLHPIPGGASARPFVTHHNALDVDLYLRIAPELYLKRLVAGGFPRVYEINRSFRNEGMSPRHNPEFTMLECYQAYADYHDMMELTQALVQAAAKETVGGLELVYQGRPVSLDGAWPRRTVLELVSDATGQEVAYDLPVASLRALCDRHDVAWEASWGRGKLVFELYEQLVEDQLWEPVFVTDHPLETSPLARPHRSDPHVVERFELIVAGRELANAFSELVDPDDQRRRFEVQAAARAAGDAEAMVVDEAYLAALELGLPPSGGLGLGVDRLVMLLADVLSIRDVILFPTLRPDGT